MTAYKNEIFGPVLQIIHVDNFIEGLEIIKNNNFGNGCAIFTGNGEAARTFTSEVDIGMIGVNIRFLFHQHFIVLVVGKIHFLEI